VQNVKGLRHQEEQRGYLPDRLPCFFKPSRNSVTRREEFQASAIDKIVQLVRPVEGEAAVAAIGVAVLRTVTCLSADFGGPLAEEFLQTTMLSE
jgi:hypothetical protein